MSTQIDKKTLSGYFCLIVSLIFALTFVGTGCGGEGTSGGNNEQRENQDDTVPLHLNGGEDPSVVAALTPPPVKIKNPEAWNQLISEYGKVEQQAQISNQLQEWRPFNGEESPPVRVLYKELGLIDFLEDLIKLNLFFKHPDKYTISFPQLKKYGDKYSFEELGYPLVREFYSTAEGPSDRAPSISYFKPIAGLPDQASVVENRPLLQRKKVYLALLNNDRFQPYFLDPVYHKLYPYRDETTRSLLRSINNILQKQTNIYYSEVDTLNGTTRQANEDELKLKPEEYDKIIAEIQDLPLPEDLSNKYLQKISPQFSSIQASFSEKVAAFNTIYMTNKAGLDPREREMVDSFMVGARQVEQAMEKYVATMNAIEKPYTYNSLMEAYFALQLLSKENYWEYKSMASAILNERKQYYYVEVTKKRS